MTRAGDIGEGVPMYFQFLKSMITFMAISALLSIPSIVFCYFGNKILEEDKDGIGLFKFTVGNIGYNQGDENYAEDVKCRGPKNAEDSCFVILGLQFSLTNVASILTACELLQMIAFFIVYFDLVRRIHRIKSKSDARICSASDYAIIIENLHPDTTVDDIKQHFSSLYGLDSIDWKGRPIVDGAIPNTNISNSKDKTLLNTWLAEVIMHCRIGDLIRVFKQKSDLMEKLLKSRAYMKMYKNDTPHGDGPNLHKYMKWENEMIKYGTQIDQETIKTVKKASKKLRHSTSSSDSGNVIAGKSSNYIKGIPFMGFVIFNYVESKARCVEDYQHYASFPFNFFMPSQLKLKGRRIRVRVAPEPDEILFENVEVHYIKKLFRRSFTACFAVLMLIVGFAIILQSSLYKEKFSKEVPNFFYCHSEIPAVYYGSYSGFDTTRVGIVRPPASILSQYDLQCANGMRGGFYAIYSDTKNFEEPLTNYEMSACHFDGTSNCPVYNQSSYCPCISPDYKDKCQTLNCFIDSINDDGTCSNYLSSTLVGCYCYDTLLSIFEGDLLSGFQKILNVDEACKTFLANYSLALVLTFVASLCTVLINVILKKGMKSLAVAELHATIDAEQRAIMIKVFFATYVNMALIALLAYGYISTLPSYLSSSQVLQGEYSDFNSKWYAQVGSFMIMTFVMESVSPLIGVLYNYFIAYPLARCWHHPKISDRSSHKFPTQADVNALEVGNIFDTTIHTSQLIALTFMAMTYGSGMPILMPLSFMTFILYFYVDKFMLCKFNKKPPHMGDAVMMVVLKVLPWAAIIRLCISCWVYSNEIIFTSSYLEIEKLSTSYFSFKTLSENYNNFALNHADKIYYGINTGSRITRGNVLPIFVFLVIVVLGLIISYIWKFTPMNILYQICKFFWKLCKAARHGNRVQPSKRLVTGFELIKLGDPLRTEMAPYTGDYFQYLENEIVVQRKCCGVESIPDLTEDEAKAGWKVAYNGAHKVKMLTFQKPTRIADVNRSKGQLKKTYEIIAGHGAYSYNLFHIPQYATIMLALKEGTESILFDNLDGEGRETHKSVLDAYTKRRNEKIIAAQREKDALDTAWDKKTPATHKVAVIATVAGTNVAPDYKEDDDDEGDVEMGNGDLYGYDED